MKLTQVAPFLIYTLLAALLPSTAYADRILQSSSLNNCQKKSDFSASLFNVVVSANNGSVMANIAAVVSVEGKAVFDVALRIYGYDYLKMTIDPCTMDLQGLCPMKPGKIDMEFSFEIGDKLDQVPGIAYTIPDLDATIRAIVNLTETNTTVACVEADFSNGKTVDLVGVKWATAVIAGLGLGSAGIISAMGHTDAAAHLAANALSLFGYFQAQAFVGLSGVDMPPIVQAWTQNFQWSMGVVRLGWMQTLCTWYQRSTGGEAARLFDSLSGISVQVSKRSLDIVNSIGPVKRGINAIAKRANILQDNGSYVVYGIQRVAFKAKIESTNLFLTGLIVYCFFIIFTVLIIAAFRYGTEIAVKQGWSKKDRFVEFRRDWKTTLKGVLFRLNLIGFPQIAVLCLWEFTQIDSAALVVLAVFFFLGTLFTLIWASWKVILIAKQSILTHQNPAHVLFSNPQIINKWGFLYVQYRASAYYFIIPFIAYIFLKSAVIAFGQKAGVAQAIALIVIEAAALIAVSVLKPFMDKSTNSFNISIYAINFINSVFLLIFTNVFDTPGIVVGVVGVILFIVNVIFAFVLLLMVLISSILVFWRVKGQPTGTGPTQLNDPSILAKGDRTEGKSLLDLDEDDKVNPYRRESLRYGEEKATESGMSLHVSTSTSNLNSRGDTHEMSYLPSPGSRPAVSPSVPMFPADRSLRSQSPAPPRSPASDFPPPSPFGNGSARSIHEFRSQNNNSPWQRGAGYDH
ncbi:transient receptor potential ion channel [Colletotrichum tamarilloi]|uniref:Transient receptor potential ion channel n=1 Tax=Colletotrichum tamarilloi TaxID=1209934 RepID=A0ABQ9QV32_9PEZI|nr:transient receptor potential ion channel [Colletotrichum tamarilloi]KAK1486005.1 transient receptor potential ion channel [Colletotrichum tamarilloi]